MRQPLGEPVQYCERDCGGDLKRGHFVFAFFFARHARMRAACFFLSRFTVIVVMAPPDVGALGRYSIGGFTPPPPAGPHRAQLIILQTVRDRHRHLGAGCVRGSETPR